MPDFATEYGIRLAAEFRVMSWDEFALYALALLSVDSRVSRHFAPDPVRE